MRRVSHRDAGGPFGLGTAPASSAPVHIAAPAPCARGTKGWDSGETCAVRRRISPSGVAPSGQFGRAREILIPGMTFEKTPTRRGRCLAGLYPLVLNIKSHKRNE